MMGACYKTKKVLKANVGQPLMYEETSMFGAEYRDNGTFCVVGPSPPRYKSKTVTAYKTRHQLTWAHDKCFLYAVALHRLTGFPIVMLIDLAVNAEDNIHCYVEKPDGKCLDAYGENDLKQLVKRYHMEQPETQPLNEATTMMMSGIDEDSKTFLKAMEAAKNQLGMKIADHSRAHAILL